MFPQVKINERDQNSQLFLGPGWSRDTEPKVYAMTSMISIHLYISLNI